MASEVEIANNALLLLGDQQITSLEDTNDRARLCKTFYARTRDVVLASYPWNFAKKRVSLALLATTPLWDFDYAYQLQPDVLRVLETNSPEIPWKREGQELLTDAGSPVYIIYITQITDPNKFTALFTEALEARLAAKLAYPIMQDRALSEKMFSLFLEKVQEAKSIDGQEGTQDELENDMFIDARV